MALNFERAFRGAWGETQGEGEKGGKDSTPGGRENEKGGEGQEMRGGEGRGAQRPTPPPCARLRTSGPTSRGPMGRAMALVTTRPDPLARAGQWPRRAEAWARATPAERAAPATTIRDAAAEAGQQRGGAAGGDCGAMEGDTGVKGAAAGGRRPASDDRGRAAWRKKLAWPSRLHLPASFRRPSLLHTLTVAVGRHVLGFGARRLKTEQVPGLSAGDTSAGENTRDGPVEGRRGGGKTVRHAEEGGQDVMWHATGGAGGGTRGGAHLGRRYPPALLPPREGEALRPGRHCLPPAPPPRDARTCAPLLGPEKTIKDAAELPCLPPPPLSVAVLASPHAGFGEHGAVPCGLAPPAMPAPVGSGRRGRSSALPHPQHPGERGGGASSRLAQGSAPLTWEQEEGRLAGTTPYLGRRGRDPKSGQGPGAPASTGAHPGLGETAHAREDGGSECERVCGNEVPPFERRDPTLTIRESQNLFSDAVFPPSLFPLSSRRDLPAERFCFLSSRRLASAPSPSCLQG